MTVTFILAEDGIDASAAVVGDFKGWIPTMTPLLERGSQRVATVTLEAEALRLPLPG